MAWFTNQKNGDHTMSPLLDNPSPPSSNNTSASLVEFAGYILAATALNALISAPLLLGLLPKATTGLIVPIAQLTPLIVALVFFAVLKKHPQHHLARLRDVLALRWASSTKAIKIGRAHV